MILRSVFMIRVYFLFFVPCQKYFFNNLGLILFHKKKMYLFAFVTSLDTEIEICNSLEPPNFMNDVDFHLIFFFMALSSTLVYFICKKK